MQQSDARARGAGGRPGAGPLSTLRVTARTGPVVGMAASVSVGRVEGRNEAVAKAEAVARAL